MSADNMIVIDKHGDKFRVSMQFASCNYYFRGDEDEFDTLDEAADEAHKWLMREVIVEYGIQIDPRCFNGGDK
jgi:hypothetical protein